MEKLSLEGVFPAMVPSNFKAKDRLLIARPWPHWRSTAVGFCYRDSRSEALHWISHSEAEFNRWRPMALLNECMVRLQGVLGFKDLCVLDGSTALLRIGSLDPACPVLCYGAALLMPKRVMEATTAFKNQLGYTGVPGNPLLTQPTPEQLLIGCDEDALRRWSRWFSESNQQRWMTVSLKPTLPRFELEEVPLEPGTPSGVPPRAAVLA